MLNTVLIAFLYCFSVLVVLVTSPAALLELAFDDTFVKSYHLELYHKPIQEFYMIKTSQKELIMICIVIIDSMLKALKNTHTHHSLLVDL